MKWAEGHRRCRLYVVKTGTGVRMKKGVRFHNIFYRYILFCLSFAIMTVHVIAYNEGKPVILFGREIFMERGVLIGSQLLVFAALSLIFYFVSWKFYVCKEGIYIRKIDLFVPWDEIAAVSHVWINEFNQSSAGDALNFYNRKTLVIYRKKYKPICIYNTSVLALYAVKFYHPEVRTSMISSTLAAVLNVLLNGWIYYAGYIQYFNHIQLRTLMIWAFLYTLKVLAVPAIMVKYQNARHGAYLFHDTAYKTNASKVIHI